MWDKIYIVLISILFGVILGYFWAFKAYEIGKEII